MARDIATIKQTNLWGKAADNGLGLEPQRADLFVVDFTSAQKGVAQASNQRLTEIFPQFVRLITLPENRTKADPVRRDSVPFQMPSWDDALDPIKILFVLDTNNQDDTSAVIQFLDAWLALTRAGRGSRFQGYVNTGWLTLDADYRVEFRFNVNLYLLRGALFGGASVQDDAQVNAFLANINAAYRKLKKQQGLVQTGNPVPALSPDQNALLAQFARQQPQTGASRSTAIEQDMVIHSIYELSNAWLGAYKFSDFSYLENSIATVEATFYVESVALEKRPVITGQALIPGASG